MSAFLTIAVAAAASASFWLIGYAFGLRARRTQERFLELMLARQDEHERHRDEIRAGARRPRDRFKL